MNQNAINIMFYGDKSRRTLRSWWMSVFKKKQQCQYCEEFRSDGSYSGKYFVCEVCVNNMWVKLGDES